MHVSLCPGLEREETPGLQCIRLTEMPGQTSEALTSDIIVHYKHRSTRRNVRVKLNESQKRDSLYELCFFT